MTTQVKVSIGHVGTPLGKVFVGTEYAGHLQGSLYNSGGEVSLYLHGGQRAVIREATDLDIADRTGAGASIIEGLKQAVAGDFASVLIAGQTWVKQEKAQA